MRRIQDLTGARFGRWTVLELAGCIQYGSSRKAMWHCECDCGNRTTVLGASLTAGKSKSCGCLCAETTRSRSTRHGMYGSRAYNAWSNMLGRCRNTNRPDYGQYGGRGISVCERWSSFENFLADMGQPDRQQTLSRIDGNGDYRPDNCVWRGRRAERSTFHARSSPGSARLATATS